MDCSASPDTLTFANLASYCFANKKFKKQSTKDLHEQIINGVCVPRWGDEIAIDIKSVKIKQKLQHFHSRYIVYSAMAEPSSRVVWGDARESLGERLFQRLGSSGLERA
jgi:hypothetical protein